MGGCVLVAADPAPLVAATRTGHMLTTRGFFNRHATLRAAVNVFRCCPLLVLLVNHALAVAFAVVTSATLQANFFVARRTSAASPVCGVARVDNSFTVWTRTPKELRVFVDCAVSEETAVLFEQDWCDYLFNDMLFDRLATLSVGTADLVKLGSCHLLV